MEPDDERARAVDEARQMITAGMIAELITDIRQMAGAIITFADKQAATDRQVAELHSLRRRNGIVSAAALGLVALLALVVIIGYSRLTDIANANNNNGRVLIECTTPSPVSPATTIDKADAVHECYERGVEGQGKAIALIGEQVLDAAICARLHADEQSIRACVAEMASKP